MINFCGDLDDHFKYQCVCFYITSNPYELIMNSMKLVILLHLLYWTIHTEDESKRGTAFAFIFGVN